MHIYLKVGDIRGGVTEGAHSYWSEVLQVGNRGKGILVSKKWDRASGELYQMALTEKKVALAAIDYTREDGGVDEGVHLRIEISDAVITSMQRDGDAPDDDAPREVLVLVSESGKIDRIKEPGTPPP